MTGDNGIPPNWKRAALSELATVVMGTSPPGAAIHEHELGVPFLQGNAEFGTRRPTAIYHCSAPERMAKPGDVLMSVRAPVGELNLADREYCIGRGLAAIRFIESDRAYGWHALDHGKLQLRRVSQGSTFDAIGKDDLAQFTVLLPPEYERRKIGAILTAVDEAIERTRAVIDQTRRLKTALLQDLLTHGLPGRHSEFIEHKQIGKVPAAWRVMQLKDAVAYWQYGLSDSLADDGAYPCLRMNNYVDGRITAEDIKYANIDQKTFKHYKLERGDILFNRTNSRELVGKVGIFDLTGDCVFASYLVRMRTDRKVARAEFLNLILNTAENQHRIKRLATPGVSQSNINAENLKRMRVALPEVDEQDAILALLTSVRRSIETEAARLIQLTDTKAALSQALLTGRVRVNEIPEI